MATTRRKPTPPATPSTPVAWLPGRSYDDRKAIDLTYCLAVGHAEGLAEHDAAWRQEVRLSTVLPNWLAGLADEADDAKRVACDAAHDNTIPMATVTEVVAQAVIAFVAREIGSEVIIDVEARGNEQMARLLAGIEARALERSLWAKAYADEDRAATKANTGRPMLPTAWDLIENEASVVEGLEAERQRLSDTIPEHGWAESKIEQRIAEIDRALDDARNGLAGQTASQS